MKLQEEKSEEWKDGRKREALDSLDLENAKLLATAPNEEARKYWEREFGGFRALFSRFLQVKPTIDWSKIQPLPKDAIRPYAALAPPPDAQIAAFLDKLVVVKLNGGLGTSMGCKGPKSVITVRSDLTFLDLTMQQIEALNHQYGVSVPLVLMNSFNTDEETAKVLRKYRQVQVHVRTFNQSRYPRINRETHLPIADNLASENLDAWYPPGHGNFYEAFGNSGLLDEYLAAGKEFAFVSNIDNMGATVDLNILNLLATPAPDGRPPPEFVMEVTDKTRADVKGGTLINYNEKLMLLEIAQVPSDHVDEFKSVSKFQIFNTNNLWAGLKAIRRLLDAKALEMEIIVNPKHLGHGLNVLQLETAAGAAIKAFSGAVGVNVPRSRFLPVKKTQDLLLVMSNLYEMRSGRLLLSPKRSFPTTPLVKLGSSFDKVSDFLGRFAGVPDLLELDHLTVSGDVVFGKGVTLKGTVIIIANHGDRIDVPAGAILENKIVSGNLRILDH